MLCTTEKGRALQRWLNIQVASALHCQTNAAWQKTSAVLKSTVTSKIRKVTNTLLEIPSI